VTPRRYAVVAGGGTGGHVLEALAVARALVARGHDRDTVELVGSRRGQEATLLEGEGFPLTLLPGRGISRQLGPRELVANFGAVAGLAWATVRAVARLARWRPKVVVSVGGYASFPAGVAAVVLRIPLVLVNVDAVPGLVHRVLGRFAVASAVAFPGTALPRAVVTGTPVREEVQAVDRSAASVARARVALGLPGERRTVGVFGGSLGARRINQAVASLGDRWAGRGDLSMYHVTGRRGWEEMDTASVSRRSLGSGPQAGRAGSAGLCYRLVPFEDRMPLLYEAVDLMVCRAGAITVAELAVAGVPAVLVPLPGAPGDHQTANARALVAAGAGVLLPDEECDADHLGAVLDDLLADADRLAAMGMAARGVGRPDAAARVAQVVDDHAC
jgi:UDP-N-acetylglucosamine--N-acetylmuramyl-(pentapeptide) pyrophosphoryl-undecaprenol N-acetylglucosamine transferase